MLEGEPFAEWEGTPSELLQVLRDQGLPHLTNAARLGRALRDRQTHLEAAGLTVKFKRTPSQRLVRLSTTPTPAQERDAEAAGEHRRRVDRERGLVPADHTPAPWRGSRW